MNPRQFLYIGGVILLGLGIFGFVDPNPVSDQSTLQFDVWENWAHTLLGIFAIAMAIVLPRVYRWWLTGIVGVGAVATAIVGFALSGREFPNLGGANLENPVDNVLHLVVGAWALAVAILTYRSEIAGTHAEVEPMKRPMEPPASKAA